MMQKNEVLALLDEFFKNQLPHVLMGMRLNDKVECFPEPTEEELKLQWVLNVYPGYDFTSSKELYKKWLLQKGIEEIHTAISESLKCLLIYKEIEREGSVPEYKKIAIRKLFYPTLVKNAQSICGKTFQHEKELLSLNTVRNAFMHDNGFVLSSRLSDGENQLIIYGIKPILFFQYGANRTPVEIGKPGPENAALMMSAKKFQIKFSINDAIALSMSEFIDMVFTCTFIKSDIEVMLKSESALLM